MSPGTHRRLIPDGRYAGAPANIVDCCRMAEDLGPLLVAEGLERDQPRRVVSRIDRKSVV